MKMKELTPEQVSDIKEREKKAYAYLKQAGFIVDAVVQKVNIGDGTFVDRVIPYLQDTRYSKREEQNAKKD